jgi:Ca2+-binding EF-hand superfamily protein
MESSLSWSSNFKVNNASNLRFDFKFFLRSMAQLAEITPELISSSGLSTAELQELLEIFQLVDLDHGGTISTEELGTLMSTMGIRSSKEETENMLNEVKAFFSSIRSMLVLLAKSISLHLLRR